MTKSGSVYSISAMMRHNPDDRLILTTVKLAETEREAKVELLRMVGVVIKDKAQVEMSEEKSWARVHLKDGVSYFFQIDSASWVQ